MQVWHYRPRANGGHAAQVALDRVIRWNRRSRDGSYASRRIDGVETGDGRGASDEEMSTADQKVERLADKLQALADRSAREGGMKAKLSQPLADDAEFVRKLKPSLIKARARGDAPTDQAPGQGRVAPSSPQLGKRSKPKQKQKRSGGGGGGGPNPWLVLGVCLAVGIATAKWIDWRGHAHPRD